ncbi:MAG: protein phosphatase 2C domain-containing protein [Gallionella sp.]
MNFTIHQASHIGDRKFNQDRVGYASAQDTLLLVLTDGMGGHLDGELAASLAMQTFVASFSAQDGINDPLVFLSDTMRCAHQKIQALPHVDIQHSPGTTCVAALIQDGRLYWGHAGDSRLYLFRNREVFVKTRDHSMVQMWLDCGVIDEEEARMHPNRNQITNCLGGVEEMFHIELAQPIEVKSGDVVFLCSDGLCGPFSDKDMVSAFVDGAVADNLDELIVQALAHTVGRADNATGLALRWGETEAAHDIKALTLHILEIH